MRTVHRRAVSVALLLLVTAAATPAYAELPRLLRPGQWFGTGQKVVNTECGWMIGDPFTLEDSKTQLALQVFTGNQASPAFLVSFDQSDGRLVELEGDPGKVLLLEGGSYGTVTRPLREDGSKPLRFFTANSHARNGWDVKNRLTRLGKCGLRQAFRGKLAHLDFFKEQSYLIAAAATAREQEIFNAYFDGRPEEVNKVRARALWVETATANFLGIPSTQTDPSAVLDSLAGSEDTEEEEPPPFDIGCDFDRVRLLVKELADGAQAMTGKEHGQNHHQALETLALELRLLVGKCNV